MGLLSTFRTIREFRQNRFGTRGQLLERQLVKFRRLVAHAAAHSPYYARLIRQRSIDPETCRPADFPVLTKQEYIDNFDEIATDRQINQADVADFLAGSTEPNRLYRGKYLVIHTSGTSGSIAYYLFTPQEWERGHLHFLRYERLGLRRRVAHVAAMRGHFHGSLMTRRLQAGLHRLFFHVQRFDINDPTHEVIAALNHFQPHTLSGYGGALKILAHYQEQGELSIQPQRMYYGGEPLSADERHRISAVFGAPIGSVYATSEHLMMGATQPDCGQMRLFEDDLIFEFEPDCAIVTNLFNRTLPLIRYRMNDVLEPAGPTCPWHPFMMAQDLVGRTEQMLRFINRDGHHDFIHPIVMAEFYVPRLRAFQIILRGDEEFCFRAVLDAALDEAGRRRTIDAIDRRLREILAQKRMDNVRFHVEPVAELGPDPRTGKFRLIVNEAAHRQPQLA